MRLVLPYPVSANRYWRSFTNPKTGRTVTVVSHEAIAYRSEAGWIAKGAGLRRPLACAVELDIRLVPKNRVCMDLDNALKVVIDSLKGIAYEDDAQVRKITAERCEPDGRARLDIVIREYVPAAPIFEEVA